MFGLFKTDPTKALKKKYLATMEKARDVQRSGDVVAAAKLYAAAEEMQKELEQAEAQTP
ncbi:MAG: DUF6435 family protein [Myxococcota bacterium]